MTKNEDDMHILGITEDLGLTNTITVMAAFVTLCSAFIALWVYVSSVRPYIYLYLKVSADSRIDIMFNMVNNGTVGAKNVEISLEDGNNIYRFDERTASDGKPYASNDGIDMNIKIPTFHQNEVIPPNFHYETFLGRGAGEPGNEIFTKPFVLIVKYKSSLPFISKIPFVGQFKEKFFLNPSMFNDVINSEKKEIIAIDLKIGKETIRGEAVRKYTT